MNDMWGNPINGSIPTNMNYNRFLPHYELIKVNGEESAKNFRMGPNSDVLLLDEANPIVYHVQTDGTGYPTVTAYDLVPHITVPPVDINQLAQRLTQLEETINARQSNSQLGKQKKQRNAPTTITEQPSID